MSIPLPFHVAPRPYPGLRSFTSDEADIFFGREEQVDQLLARLKDSRFLGIVGQSGCGKSSLVQAGLIAALETGLMTTAGAGWRVAAMRPGNHPLKNLADSLVDDEVADFGLGSAADTAAFLLAILRRGPLGLVEVLRESPLPEGENLLLLVDQFEEIFRFRNEGNGDEADSFVSLLLATARQIEVPVYVVLTMRADFIGECALFPGLPEVLSASQFLTPRMTREQRGAAIEGPARVFGGRVEPAVVNQLLNDMGPGPDQLPLMQHALMRLWTRASQAQTADGQKAAPNEVAPKPPAIVLTLKEYETIGGIADALSAHADEAFDKLGDEQKPIAETLFRCLSERGKEQLETRRLARMDAVAAVAGVSCEQVAAVVEVFCDPDLNFLQPAVPILLEAETVLDVSHESLIRQWQRLRGWVDEEASWAAMYRRLEETARLWQKGRAALWGTPDLEAALDWKERAKPNHAWARRYGGDFELAVQFLEASQRKRTEDVAAAERKRTEDVAAAEKASQRELEQKKKELKLVRLLLGVATVGILIALGLMGLAFHERSKAVQATKEANLQKAEALIGNAHGIRLSRQPGQRFEALVKIREAAAIGLELGQPPQWFDPLRNEAVAALTLPDVWISKQWPGYPPGTIWAEVSPDFELYAQMNKEGSVSVLRIADDVEVAPLQLGEPAQAAGFGPGGLFALLGNSGRFQLWDLKAAKPVLPFGPQDPVDSWAFRPDGRLVLLTYRNSSFLGLYETDTGNFRRLEAKDITKDAKFFLHPREPVAATVSSSSSILQVLDLRTGKVLQHLDLPWRGSGSCAWRPDGLTLGVSDGNGSLMNLYAFDLAALALCKTPRPIQGPAGDSWVQFNPAGDRFAVRSWNGIVHLYDANTGRLLFSTHPLGLLYSFPDGKNFDPSALHRIQFDHSGLRLAAARVGDSEDQIGVWTVADAREYRVLPLGRTGGNNDYALPAIHPQGRLAAQSSEDGCALYDLETGSRLAIIPFERGAQVCFDGRGNLLTNSFAGLFRWPVRPDAARPGRLTLGPPVGLPFKPGNRQIASSKDGLVVAQAMYLGYGMDPYAGGWILHPEAPNPRQIEKGTSMNSTSVSPDGHWVAFGVHVNRVNVYDAATGQPVPYQFPAGGHDYSRFSRDGCWLVTANDVGRVYAVGDTWEPQKQLGPGEPWDFSPDSSVVVLGMTDGVYRFVERATGRELVRLEDPDRVAGPAVFTPDGTGLVVAANDGLRFWDLRRIREELAKLGLDWDLPPYPPAIPKKDLEPLQVTVELGVLDHPTGPVQPSGPVPRGPGPEPAQP